MLMQIRFSRRVAPRFRAKAGVLLALLGVLFAGGEGLLMAQQNVPPIDHTPPTWPANGVRDERSGAHAFENATIIVAPGQTLENATLLIRDGRVVAVGRKVTVPADAVRHDATGEVIAPAFIDPWTGYGVSIPPVPERKARQEQLVSERAGAWSWNEALHPEFNAAEAFAPSDDAAEQWRKAGFGAVVAHRQDGIQRGSGVFTLTLGEGREHQAIIDPHLGAFFSFSKGASRQPYPSSLMGAIALLRQTYLDAEWYARGPRPATETNLSLRAWNDLLRGPQAEPGFFEVDDPFDALRAQKIADEFGVRYTYRGSGKEYRRLEALKTTGAGFIVPLDFPEAYDVSDPLDAELLDYDDLLHWELAPTNPSRMVAAGIPTAFTADGLDDPSQLRDRLRVAMEQGLSEADALAGLTTLPADWLGVAEQIGTLEPGKLANFLRLDGPVFEEGSSILETWVAGEGYRYGWPDGVDRSGRYRMEGSISDTTFEYNPETYEEYARVTETTLNGFFLDIDGDPGKPEFAVRDGVDGDPLKLNAKPDRNRVAFSFFHEGTRYRLSGWWLDGNLSGTGETESGARFSWSAIRMGAVESAEEEDENDPPAIVSTEVPMPFQAFGRTRIPAQHNVVFRNATVWTNGDAGILENADVWIKEGQIQAVGPDLKAKGASEYDVRGLHLTSGIIDEHSHIAIRRGVNEGTQASSAEVRIGDAIDPEDIDIYRQLSGGVTAAQLLHGSANPIGGQSALIKLRWGALPEQMKIDGAPGFIKFALGENVKQSNWGDDNQVRFPQTRMGVEQVYMDHFTRARAYGAALEAGGAEADPDFRRDLDLEALYEVLQSERFITCHSYIQSEINMLMAVAERFGFRINTFTHILEGYKVADKMAEHGAGASTFADWWAYKFEVNDAIPYNAAILNEMGVVTAINSDDAEMGRRLNQEAAKTVKYGGVSEEDAWKMVTLNPAKLLHLDQRMGSVEVGKDADLVLWTDNPLSIYAKVLQTWVDGRLFFDVDADLAARRALTAERQRLLDKMLEAADGGAPTKEVEADMEHNYHCDDMHDEGRTH